MCIVGPSAVTKENFVDQALLLYKFIHPRVYGIPTLGVMIKGLNQYARSKKIKIVTYPLVKPRHILETVAYIKKGLSQDAPIMMLTWNTQIPHLKYHWVTITGYYMGVDGNHYVVISNYGKKEIININQWVKEKSIYKGLLYFIIQDYN